MIVKTNIKWVAMTDDAILKQIGQFLKSQRILKNKTQAQIAEASGVNRYTIGKIEKGDSVTLSTMIQVLRTLDLLYVLEHFSTIQQISPLEAVKLQEKKRQRATGTRKKDKNNSDW